MHNEPFDLEAIKARQEQARADAEAGRIRTAHLTAQAIANCTLCDPEGYRGATVCDHEDHTEAARLGREKCMAALAKGKQPSTIGRTHS